MAVRPEEEVRGREVIPTPPTICPSLITDYWSLPRNTRNARKGYYVFVVEPIAKNQLPIATPFELITEDCPLLVASNGRDRVYCHFDVSRN